MIKKATSIGILLAVALACIWASAIISLVKIQFPQRAYDTEYDLIGLAGLHGMFYLAVAVFVLLSVDVPIILDRLFLRNKLCPEDASRLLRARLRPVNIALVFYVLILAVFWAGTFIGRPSYFGRQILPATMAVSAIAGIWSNIHGTAILIRLPSLKAISPITKVCVGILILIVAGIIARQVSLLRNCFNYY